MKQSQLPSALLAAALFAGSALMPGCGSDTPADTGAPTTDPSGESTGQEGTTGYYDDLEDYDFEEYEFRILDNDTVALFLTAEEMTGEKVNDAAWQRNAEVEDLLNVKIVSENDQEMGEIRFQNAILADDAEAVDLFCFRGPGQRDVYITANVLYDWKEIPNLKLDCPWYNQSANEAYSIAGKQYFGVSDITLAVQHSASVLFNIGMAEDFQIESPYTQVKEGRWTMDALLTSVKDVYSDLNNNGEADEADRYGLVGHINLFGRLAPSAGETEVLSSPDGFVVNLFSDKLAAFGEKLRTLYRDENVLASTAAYDALCEDRALFIFYSSDPAKLREVEIDFGYLPYPKYDEAQENYYNEASGGMMAVPINAPDIERTGAVIEALSAGSARYLRQAFVDTYIENKVLRDEESVENYRLAYSTHVYSLSYNIDPAGMLASHKFYAELLRNDAVEHASYYASVREAIETAYEELYNAALANQ